MSKEYFIISILNEMEFTGIVDQTLYDLIVQKLTEAFSIERKDARQTTTRVLKELFN